MKQRGAAWCDKRGTGSGAGVNSKGTAGGVGKLAKAASTRTSRRKHQPPTPSAAPAPAPAAHVSLPPPPSLLGIRIRIESVCTPDPPTETRGAVHVRYREHTPRSSSRIGSCRMVSPYYHVADGSEGGQWPLECNNMMFATTSLTQLITQLSPRPD